MKTLPAGKYWIGDLCYVLSHDDSKFNWREFCDFCFMDDETGRKNEGIVTHQGITFAYFGTAHGDGCYNDQFGNEYGVDAGMIGCIPVASIIDKDGLSLGTVHEFSKPFTASYSEYDKGTICFGHISIPTDGCDEDEYEDRYDFDDEQDFDNESDYENARRL
jgi:hypothetical protein